MHRLCRPLALAFATCEARATGRSQSHGRRRSIERDVWLTYDLVISMLSGGTDQDVWERPLRSHLIKAAARMRRLLRNNPLAEPRTSEQTVVVEPLVEVAA